MNRLVFITLLFVHWSPAQALNLENQMLRYSVKYTTHNAGELEIIISRDHDRIKTTVISHLSTIAKMFLPGLTAETWFRIDSPDILVEQGHDLSHESETVKRSFVIDRENNLVKYLDGETFPTESTDLFESTSFPMILINSDISEIEGQVIREISTKRVRWYVYLAPEQQTLDLNGNSYDAWKVTRHQRGDPSRTVTVWLDRNNQNTPLKIITTRKGKDTVMVLVDSS